DRRGIGLDRPPLDGDPGPPPGHDGLRRDPVRRRAGVRVRLRRPVRAGSRLSYAVGREALPAKGCGSELVWNSSTLPQYAQVYTWRSMFETESVPNTISAPTPPL